MARVSASSFTFVTLDYKSPVPLYRQLYQELRKAILTGRLPSGSQLPSTRGLADEVGISRTTVLTAFDQLAAEGYLEGHIGSGTYVATRLPDELLTARQDVAVSPSSPAGPGLSRQGERLAHPRVVGSDKRGRGPFRSALPALDAFPFELWARLWRRYLPHTPPELLDYGDPAGYLPLREAIAAHLAAARGVHCRAEQVIIVAGAQQGLDLVARLVLDPGDAVWIEDPGYPGARDALVAAGARVVPVPVDEEGLDVAAGTLRCPEARLAYVTPSHQAPLGVTMSLSRRLALLQWASQTGAWILEDDYDSEYRYASRPLAALQGLDSEGRVIYIGAFSKVLFPSLRLGHLVVPTNLAPAFAAARAVAGLSSPSIEQAVLADFIAEGHFARHIRRMRTLYAERQAAMVEAASHELAGLLEVCPAEAGMNLLGWLPEGVADWVASKRAAAHGLEIRPLSFYRMERSRRGGLQLGYSAFDPREIRQGIGKLADALRGLVADS